MLRVVVFVVCAAGEVETVVEEQEVVEVGLRGGGRSELGG